MTLNEQQLIGWLSFLGASSALMLLNRYYHRTTTESVAESTYLELIGNTSLVKLHKLSQLTGCDIYVKVSSAHIIVVDSQLTCYQMENFNPGGTGKDRAAKRMLLEAMKDARYHPGCHITEGTSGSTGIALAALCNSLGLQLHIVLPDDQSHEKRRLLETFGVQLKVVPVCAISNSEHYVNVAKRLAEDLNGIFINQFENIANFQVHYEETGPELWKQCQGQLDAFVMSAGTGGTIAGVSK